MEDRDGRIARDLCLGRMVASDDLATRRSLWRAALRYAQKDRAGRRGLESGVPALLVAGSDA